MPSLHLAVQVATDRATPDRSQLRRWVQAAVATLAARSRRAIGSVTLTLRFVDVDEGRALNHGFRGKDYATNVLTFPLDAPAARGPRVIEADIVICVPVVEREAREQEKTFREHTAHLVVHGVLHAAGHDHETPREAETMEAIEREVLSRFRIADPYRD